MDFVTSDVIESRMIPTMNENGRLVDVIFGAVKLELRQNAFSFLTETFLFKFLASFSATYQKIVLHFSSPLTSDGFWKYSNQKLEYKAKIQWRNGDSRGSQGGTCENFDRDALVIFLGLKFTKMLFFWVSLSWRHFCGVGKLAIIFLG